MDTQKTVMLRRFNLHGNITRMQKAVVLSQRGDTLKVLPEGQRKPIMVKASDTQPLPRAMRRGMIIQSALPDSPNSLARILESRN